MLPRFCCNDMETHLGEGEVAISYDDISRSYGIVVLSESYSVPLESGCTRQTIYYCPWCGTKLPKTLTDELYDILLDELNLDGLDDPHLPEEFKSGEWWRRRNL